MEARRVPAQLIAIACVAVGCSQREAPRVPASVDAWARTLLEGPVAEVCEGDASGYFCAVRAELIPQDVRALGARSISLQGLRSSARYLDLDWGGGHVEAHGVVIGPRGWQHEADAERREQRLRDGVYRYDLRSR